MNKVQEKISELNAMKSYPDELSFSGNLELLKATKISIVGTRRPSKYSKELTHKLALALSKAGVCVVSGGAMGIDAVAHMGAGSSSTISVLPCGVDVKYPAVNKNLLSEIEKKGLLLSQFQNAFKATPWSFVLRNELVVALGKVLVVSEAELGSGSMRSVEFALKMGKEIYVFPQRIGESAATNELLKNNKAQAIYNIDEFVSKFAPFEKQEKVLDNFSLYINSNPSYEEAVRKYPERIFEAEVNGEIEIKDAKIFLL